MTLPASGPISLLNLQDEFGGTNPIAINEYYRGGANVSSALAQIPASGQVDLNIFHGISTSVLNGARFVQRTLLNSTYYQYIGGGTFAYYYTDNTQTYKTTTDFKTATTKRYTMLSGEIPGQIMPFNGGLVAIGHVSTATPGLYQPYKSIGSEGSWLSTTFSVPGSVNGYTCANRARCVGSLYGSEIAVFPGGFGALGGPYTVNWAGSVVIDSSGIMSYGKIASGYLTIHITDIAYGSGLCTEQGGDGLFMVALTYGSIPGGVSTSPDGKNWKNLPMYDAVNVGVLTPANIYGVSCCEAGAGRLVAITDTGRPMVMSADGSKMDVYARLPNMLTSLANAKLAFGNGYFLCVGKTTLAAPHDIGTWISTDGVSWNYIQRIELSGQTLSELEYHDGKFYLYTAESYIWIANA